MTVPEVPAKTASLLVPVVAVPTGHATVPLVPVQKSDVVFHSPLPPVPADAPLGSHVRTCASAGVEIASSSDAMATRNHAGTPR